MFVAVGITNEIKYFNINNRNIYQQMKELVSTEFFHTLQEASQAGIDKNADILQNEYDDFANIIFSVGTTCHECIQSEKTDSRIVCHNMLIYTRVELSGLKKFSIKKSSISFSYLEKAIELIDKQANYIEDFVDCPLKHKTVRLKWLGTLLDYVEWVYGLHEFLNQNDEKVSLKVLFDTFNPIFGIEVKDYAQYFRTIKNRVKGDRTTLLDMQKKLLIQRMEEPEFKNKKMSS